MNAQKLRSLHRLARAYGVQTAYETMAGRRRLASPESVMAVLRALGVPVHGEADVAEAMRQVRQARWREGAPPVAVIWKGHAASLGLRLPAEFADHKAACHLQLEDGERRTSWHKLGSLPRMRTALVEGRAFVVKRFPLPAALPNGYHRLELELPHARLQTLLIAAPRQVYSPADAARRWGVFLPLYALHSARSWGAGDWSDLRALIDWTAEQGGSVVGTLPMLPAFLDEPFEPSPYSPVSRRLWNEFYVDPTQLPELKNCPAARALLESSHFLRELKSLRVEALVDYRRQMTLKRQVLEQLAEKCFTRSSKHRAALETFLREHPHVRDYARFRAAVESRHGTWEQWPPRQRAGRLKRGDYSEAAERYYLYAQWQAHEQVAALARSARGRGVQLYLDLPLGTHRGGFDVWREQDLFALQASGGAPPDPVFTKGQDWGFAPLHPRRLREQGHRHFIEVVRHHLRHAGLLRIDHVMGLHRLYWVPQGLPASEGAYVSYPAEELYAILCLESHRHQAMIVGENLGTVPAAVNAALRRHRAREMFVAQYELKPSSSGGLRPVPARCVAGLNTHDMPPFRAFWEGLDIADRRELGLLDSKRARQEADRRRALKRALVALLMREQRLRGRNPDAGAVLRACLEHLGASDAEVLLVNLEDLWLETEAQNTPATTTERINWRRKAKLSLEELGKSAEIADVLRRLDSLRRRRKERK